MKRRRGRFNSNLTDAALAFIFNGFRDGKTVSEIQKELADVYGHTLGERQIRTYRADWKANDILRAKTATVEWGNVQGLLGTGVLLEHLPLLRKVAYWASKTLDVPLKSDPDGFVTSGLLDFAPTYITLRWQSYVLSYSPTVEEPLDIWVIGELYAMRDVVAEVTKTPIETEDLDAWITFTPWRDAMNIFEPELPNPLTRYKKHYDDAIEQGEIQPLKHKLDVHTSNTTRGALAVCLASVAENYDQDITLLPSQQWKGKPSQTIKLTVGKKKLSMDIEFNL